MHRLMPRERAARAGLAHIIPADAREFWFGRGINQETNTYNFWYVFIRHVSHQSHPVEVTYRYGRVNTNGQETIKRYRRSDAARADAEKKIEAKLTKGYRHPWQVGTLSLEVELMERRARDRASQPLAIYYANPHEAARLRREQAAAAKAEADRRELESQVEPLTTSRFISFDDD